MASDKSSIIIPTETCWKLSWKFKIQKSVNTTDLHSQLLLCLLQLLPFCKGWWWHHQRNTHHIHLRSMMAKLWNFFQIKFEMTHGPHIYRGNSTMLYLETRFNCGRFFDNKRLNKHDKKTLLNHQNLWSFLVAMKFLHWNQPPSANGTCFC